MKLFTTKYKYKLNKFCIDVQIGYQGDEESKEEVKHKVTIYSLNTEQPFLKYVITNSENLLKEIENLKEKAVEFTDGDDISQLIELKIKQKGFIEEKKQKYDIKICQRTRAIETVKDLETGDYYINGTMVCLKDAPNLGTFYIVCFKIEERELYATIDGCGEDIEITLPIDKIFLKINLHN